MATRSVTTSPWLQCVDCCGEGALERPAELGGPVTFTPCPRCKGSGIEPCACGRGEVEHDRGAAAAVCGLCLAEDAGRRRYVNAYSVARCYGGPEEGGWWYDAGEPLASVPVESDEDEERERERLRALFAPDFEGERHRSSVLGGDNLEIYVEDEVAAPFPSTQPHYE